MALGIYFSDDIRNALLAADKASTSAAAHCMDGPTLRAYLEGYRAALTTVALAFDIPLDIIAGRRETLEMETRTIPMMRNAE